ncbi:MAG: GTP-binding protein [Methanobacteriota archaeon]|nr:MAG: GTP-binding protein [Euryarchaeota archaeon]
MASVQEKIREIEEEIRRTPYNKATQHHIGRLKAKLARLREEGEKRSGGASGPSYGVRKSGDATVVLVGFPSVGKSTILNRLTNAESPVGDYDFTTLDVVPGMMEHRGARIQILDVPGLIKGAASGRGRGREVISVVRSADLIVMVLDIHRIHELSTVERELYEAGIRINRKPPDIAVKRRSRGGVSVSSTVRLTHLDEAMIKAVLAEYRIHNAEVLIREDVTVDELIDGISRNRVYTKAVVVLNKTDLATSEEIEEAQRRLPEALLISAENGSNMEALKERIYEDLEFIRVYMKPQGSEADLEEPLIMKKGASVGDVCDRLHRDFRRRFRFGRIWGSSVRYPGQRVGIDHQLADGDIVSLILEK